MNLRLLIKTLCTTTTIFLTVLVVSNETFSRQTAVSRTANPTQVAEVEQAIRNFYKAFIDGDHEGVASFSVDETVASTDHYTADELKEVRRDLSKYPKGTNKHRLNLGFEGGIVH